MSDDDHSSQSAGTEKSEASSTTWTLDNSSPAPTPNGNGNGNGNGHGPAAGNNNNHNNGNGLGQMLYPSGLPTHHRSDYGHSSNGNGNGSGTHDAAAMMALSVRTPPDLNSQDDSSVNLFSVASRSEREVMTLSNLVGVQALTVHPLLSAAQTERILQLHTAGAGGGGGGAAAATGGGQEAFSIPLDSTRGPAAGEDPNASTTTPSTRSGGLSGADDTPSGIRGAARRVSDLPFRPFGSDHSSVPAQDGNTTTGGSTNELSSMADGSVVMELPQRRRPSGNPRIITDSSSPHLLHPMAVRPSNTATAFSHVDPLLLSDDTASLDPQSAGITRAPSLINQRRYSSAAAQDSLAPTTPSSAGGQPPATR